MKKKNPKDKLENLFGGLFNDSQKVQQPAGWNVPSENVWDTIQKGLASEKKQERKFLYWHWVAAAASVLLLLSAFQLYLFNQQIQDLSRQLAKNDQVTQKIQMDLQDLNEQKIQTANSQNKQLPQNNPNQGTSLNLATPIGKKQITKATAVFNNTNTTFKSFKSKFVSPSSPCLLYTSPSPRDQRGSRMPSSA